MLRILAIIFIILFGLNTAQAQSKEQVYAGIILHVMKYVEWPSYDQKMTIGVVNNPQLVRALQGAASGKKVHFKDVSIKTLDDAQSASDVDVMFFPKKSISTKLKSAVPVAEKNGILVITEEKSMSTDGACINFFLVQGKLKFELYESLMKKWGFKVSDQLKKFAVIK